MSKRLIIRGACLSLLGLCVILWGWSYFYLAIVWHGSSSSILTMSIERGKTYGGYRNLSTTGKPGWNADWINVPSEHPFKLHLLDGDFLGFEQWQLVWGDWHFGIPFWVPTLLLALLSWFAWRKTASRKELRGFPVEPLVRRRESNEAGIK